MRLLALWLLLLPVASAAYTADGVSGEQRAATIGLNDTAACFVDAESGVQVEPAISGRPKGRPFTRKQKEVVKQQNADENDGKNRCEDCGTETIPAQKHVKGVTPPLNEAHVDHVIPQAKGGKSETDNGQVLCRDCNIKKGDKLPSQGSER